MHAIHIISFNHAAYDLDIIKLVTSMSRDPSIYYAESLHSHFAKVCSVDI